MSNPAVGARGQMGFVPEVAWGTPVSPVTKFIEFISESLSLELGGAVSKSIRADRATYTRKTTTKAVGGDINIEVVPGGEFGTLLKNALGASTVVAGTSSTYTHTIKAHTSLPEGLTFEIGRDIAKFTYSGSKINTLSMSFAPGEIITSTFGIMAKSETGVLTSVTPCATATYDDAGPFTGVQSVLSVNSGVTTAGVMSASFNLNNNLYGDKFTLGSNVRDSLIEQGRIVEGTMNVEFDDLDLYTLFINGTYAALTITCTSDEMAGGAIPYSMTLTFPRIQYTGSTPNISGPEIILVDCPFVALATSTDVPELTITLVNADATL